MKKGGVVGVMDTRRRVIDELSTLAIAFMAPGFKDTQRAVKKRSREEPVDLSAAVGVMRSWFQNSVLFSSKLGPSLIFSGSSLRRGNGELSCSYILVGKLWISFYMELEQLPSVGKLWISPRHGVRIVTFCGEAMGHLLHGVRTITFNGEAMDHLLHGVRTITFSWEAMNQPIACVLVHD
ncbi:hypothetical protein F2Q70_00021052 [Brassica cretica]|uniref:Uncharacterized protein n=2 Tax=Brassica cretica TaxID=69181 RepID=A0A3N6UIJ1_BRACR|nr:hypothetical protein F2Q70_00021052 [Brassica cretica]KAF2559682.1 hypothetical protein F2Q68_00014532 [Brassica cretica]KAF3612218.1 hypothetical protein DY000_02047036 [Brassica cretica]